MNAAGDSAAELECAEAITICTTSVYISVHKHTHAGDRRIHVYIHVMNETAIAQSLCLPVSE